MEQVSRAAHTGVSADALEDSPARWVEPGTPLVGKHCDEAGDVSFCPCRLQKVFSCNLKGLSPVTCEIIWSYISAEPHVGQIFGLACCGTYSFRWVFGGQPLISVAGGLCLSHHSGL